MTNVITKIKIIDAKIMLDVRMKVMANFLMMNVTIYFWITKKIYTIKVVGFGSKISWLRYG